MFKVAAWKVDYKIENNWGNTLDYMNLDKNITWSGITEKGIVKSIIFIYVLVTTVILDKLPTIAGCSCSSFSSFFYFHCSVFFLNSDNDRNHISQNAFENFLFK